MDKCRCSGVGERVDEIELGLIKEVDKEVPVGARSNIVDPGRVRELVNGGQFGGFVVLGRLRCSCWNGNEN